MRNRFPPFGQILPVYAVIATMYYAWSFVIFAYKLPGWLYYLNLGEVGGILAHALTTNLIESLALLALLLAVCALLPPRFLRDEFVARGTVASLVIVGSMMIFLLRFAEAPQIESDLYPWLAATAALAIVLAAFSTRVGIIRKIVIGLSDRLVVLLYILFPLSILALAYVALRAVLV